MYAFVRFCTGTGCVFIYGSRVGVSPGSGRGEDARSVYTMHGRLAVWLGAEYRRYADPFAQTGPFRMLRLLGLHDFPKQRQPYKTVRIRTSARAKKEPYPYKNRT